jgi:hypothetical protein
MCMATIVEHRKSGEHYIVIGAGYGMWASARPNRVFGDLLANDRSGSEEGVCVSDAAGNIGWLDPREVRLVSVDGVSPGETIARASTDR